MPKLFGTDGVRGVANRELTPELAFYLGRAAAAVLAAKDGATGRRILVGRDTRASGPMLEAALIAGANSVGASCERAGVVPTPGVAYLTREGGFAAGAMISASHNPVEDNGIKFFSGGGFKLSDEDEAAIEEGVARLQAGDDPFPRPTGGEVGGALLAEERVEAYVDFLAGAFPLDLRGMKIVLDCAHGAAHRVAPAVFERLGAEVTLLAASPNGVNINVACGSTHPEFAREAVVRHGAHAGFTYDGDADRVQAIDESGTLIDGDGILAILALDLLERGALPKGKIAVTPYSNLGLRTALEAAGGGVIEAPAGDRFVLEAMLREGLALGGEQSGHIVILEKNTTGDGILTSLALLAVARRRGALLSELARAMTRYPQVLENVRVRTKVGWQENQAIRTAIQRGEEAIGGRGRLFVRASGTEPLIRVMGEGEDEERVRAVVQSLVDVIQKELGADC